MSADYLFEIGQDLYRSGRYQDASHEFKKVLLVEPGHEGARRYLELISGEDPAAEAAEKAAAMDRALSVAAKLKPVSSALAPIVVREQQPQSVSAQPVVVTSTQTVAAAQPVPVQKEEALPPDTETDEIDSISPAAASSGPQKFQTYLLEKPAEQVKQEEAMEERKKSAAPAQEKPSYIPPAALPSVDLRGNATYTYINYHLSRPFRSASSSLSGRFYDYNLSYSGLWKDNSNSFHYDYAYLNLVKPDMSIGFFEQYIDLYPLRLQSQDFTGMKLDKFWESPFYRTTFAGGNTETSVSGSNSTVEYHGQVYGLKQAFKPMEGLDVQSAVLYLENKAVTAGGSGTTALPRNNLVGFSGASLQLPYDFTVSAQLAHCMYNPDNDVSQNVQDWDYRVAADLRKSRYSLGAAYEFVGSRYASVGNPANYQDYKGWNLYGNYRVTDAWMLNGYTSYYHDNVANDNNKPRTHNTILNLSSYHQITREQSANLSYTHFVSNPAGVSAGPSGDTDIYRLDYFFPFFHSTRMGLNYMFATNDSGGSSSNHSHTAGGTVFRGFGRGSSWFLSQQFTDTIYKGSDDTVDAITSFNLNYVLNSWLTLYLNSSYDWNKVTGTPAHNTFSGSSGFKYWINPDTNFNMEYSVNSYDPKIEKRNWPKNWSLLFYVSQNFRLKTPPNFGIIDGYVNKDIAEEKGVEGVSIFLEDRREAVTDSRGYYKFLYVTPGAHKVSLDLSNIPPDWAAPELEKTANVKARKSFRVDFRLIQSVMVAGKVFIDLNADTFYEDNEEPLDNIAVTLEPGGHFTRTDSEGSFKFAYLLPGKYTAKIRTEDLPMGYKLISEPEITVDLKQGEKAADVDFSAAILSAEKK